MASWLTRRLWPDVPPEVAASRAAARDAATGRNSGYQNPFDDAFRSPHNSDSSSSDDDDDGEGAAARPAPPPFHLRGVGFPPLPPAPAPPAAPPVPAPPAAPPAPARAPSSPRSAAAAAATAAEVTAAAAAAGIDVRPRRRRTPEERQQREYEKIVASLSQIGVTVTGQGSVERTLKPDAVKNIPDFHGAKVIQGIRTEQDVTSWVSKFMSYMNTQRVTAQFDICHYAFLALRGEALALAESLRQAGTWPLTFAGIVVIFLSHFAPPAAFEDCLRQVTGFLQSHRKGSKAYILRCRRLIQHLETLYNQVHCREVINVDGSASPLNTQTSSVTTTQWVSRLLL